jgi:hypothetical protein
VRTDNEEDRLAEELRRRADRIAALIVSDDYPAIDTVIEVRKLKELVEEEMPDKIRLFEMIYESRFRRLWQEHRSGRDGQLPQW